MSLRTIDAMDLGQLERRLAAVKVIERGKGEKYDALTAYIEARITERKADAVIARHPWVDVDKENGIRLSRPIRVF